MSSPNSSDAVGAGVDPSPSSIGQLRQSSFVYVRDLRPGDLPDAFGKTQVSEVKLSLPEPDETRYIFEKLRVFAGRYAVVIPDNVRRVAQYFEPPIEAPSEQQIINEPMAALRSLESIAKHVNFGKEDKEIYDRLIEEVRYVVESSSRAILGLGKNDPTEYQHVLRTLSSATHSFERFLGPVEQGLRKIPLPEPPPPPLPDPKLSSSNPDERAKTKTPLRDLIATLGADMAAVAAAALKRIQVGLQNFADRFGSGVRRAASVTRLWSSRVGDVVTPPMKAVGHGIVFPFKWSFGLVKTAGEVVAGAIGAGAHVVREGLAAGLKSAKAAIVKNSGLAGQAIAGAVEKFWSEHPKLVMGGVTAAVTAGTAFLAAEYVRLGWWIPFHISPQTLIIGAAAAAGGTMATIYGHRAAFRFMLEEVGPRIGQAAGAICTGAALVVGAIAYGVKTQVIDRIVDFAQWAARNIRDTKLYRRFFAQGNVPNKTSSYAFMSSDAVSYFKKFGRKTDKTRAILSQDPGFWDRMGVLDVHVLESKGGATIQLERFLDRVAQDSTKRDQVAELRKHIYRTKQFDPILCNSPQIDESLVSMPCRPGRMSLLLPLGYQVTAISFHDRGGNRLSDPKSIEVEECALGSAKVEVPFGASSVRYLTRQGQFAIPPLQLERLKRLLPQVETFKGLEGEAYSEALAAFKLTKTDEMRLLFGHQIDRGFYVVDDNFVRSFLSTAGTAVAESVGGMRLGSKDSLSYYSAAMFNADGIPAVLISGLVPNPETRTYSLKTGHSQTAVLTEDGALVCDLSDKAKALKELGSKSLVLRERFGLLNRLRGLNYHQVFDYSAEVREVITRTGKELHRFNDLANSFFNWIGFGTPFVRRTYRDTKVDRSIVTDFDRLGVPYEETAVRGLSKKLALEKLIDYSRKQGAATQVYQFHRENPKMPQLTGFDLTTLPKEHQDLASYDIRARVLNFTAEALSGPGFTPVARRAAADWVGARIPTQKSVLAYTHESAHWTKLNQFHNTSEPEQLLSPKELVSMLTPNAISHLSPEQSKQLLFGVLSLHLAPIRESGVFAQKPEVDNQTLIQLASIAHSLSEQMGGKTIPFIRKEKESIAILAAQIGASLLKAAKEPTTSAADQDQLKAAVNNCAKTIAVVTDLGEGDQVNFFFNLLMLNKSEHAVSLVAFAKAVGRDALFGSREGSAEIERHLKSLGNEVTQSFCERQLKDQDFVNWWQTLDFFKTLELSPATHADQGRIKKHMERELKREARKGQIRIGFPDEVEHPISFICSKLIDRHSVDRIKIGQALEEHGLLNQGDLRSIWPEVPESKAFELLRREAKPINTNHPEDLYFGSPKARYSELLPISQIRAVASELLGSDLPAVQAALAYNLAARKQNHWSEVAIENMRDRFPEEWRRFVEEFDGGNTSRLVNRTLRDFYHGVSKEEAYRGILAFAAAGVSQDPSVPVQRVVSDLIQLPTSATSEQLEQALRPVEEFLRVCDNQEPPFGGLSTEAKRAAVIGSALIADVQASWRAKYDQPGFSSLFNFFGKKKEQKVEVEVPPIPSYPDNVPEDKKAPQRSAKEIVAESRLHAVTRFFADDLGLSQELTRIVEDRVPNTGKTAEASVWRALFAPGSSNNFGRQSVDLSGIEKESSHSAEMFRNRFREPLPQFLFSRAGSVFVPANSGDFRGYRDYAEGDSLRHVDWKRSVKDGSLAVRLRDEDETRNIRLVYDSEFLVNAYKNWTELSATERQSHDNPLRELFVLCHLAAAENVKVDLVLFGRSHQITYDDVVKRSSSSQRGVFQSKRLARQLETHIRAATAVFEAERKIYGRDGMPGVDIFSASDLPAKQGQLHLFAIAPRNLDDSHAERLKLKRNRILSASLNESSGQGRGRRLFNG